MAQKPEEQSTSRTSSVDWLIVAGLVGLVAAVYGQVASHEFLNYDDPQFVFFNKAVQNGDFHWAFTSTSLTWLPLTWLSYMLDFRLFGLHAGGYLIVNAILHALSACLLFGALRLMTRATWPSAFVAAIFAIHPAHVESVAWISERKDVLSTLLAIVAILCYAKRRIWLATIAMALSLMAKQTYVTLPFVLLLLDYWPLRRLRSARDLRGLLIEKIPMFVLAIAGSFMAIAGQETIGSVRVSIPVVRRIANAVVAYARYLGKGIVPVRLAVLYPIHHLSDGAILLSALLLIAITVAAWLLRRRAPYFLVGWLWFLGVLVPVIGLIQIGGQAIADRYTYFAYTGIFIAIIWGLAELKLSSEQIAGIAVFVIAIFAILAWRQVGYWKNCDTLFTHTIDVTGENAVAEYSLGQYLQLSDPDRALVHLRHAIDIGKDFARDRNNPQYNWFTESYVAAGTALLVQAQRLPGGSERNDKLRESIAMSQSALQIDPSKSTAQSDIALAEGYLRAAAPAPAPAAATAPKKDYTLLRNYLVEGTALSGKGQFEAAVAQFRKAVEFAPEASEAHVYLALGLLQTKKGPEAVSELKQAKAINAVAANEMLTHALRLQPSPDNLDMLVAQIQAGPPHATAGHP